MRDETNAKKVQQFMVQMGRKTKGPCRIYFTGGASAVLEDWRSTTLDIDLHFDPEPKGAFEAIAEIKRSLNINIELAKPSDFIPEIPGWESRSSFVEQVRDAQFFHYDFVSQALSKLERGHEKDLLDVKEMHQRELVDGSRLMEYFEMISPRLLRFPAIDADSFRKRVETMVEELNNEN
jgi:hypothetical protein